MISMGLDGILNNASNKSVNLGNLISSKNRKYNNS